MIALLWLKDNWRLAVVLALIAALGVQSYRLLGVQSARDKLALEKAERITRDAMRETQNVKNKERTDEEFLAARGRARTVVVRQPAEGISGPAKVELAGSSDESTTCFGGRELSAAVTDWAKRAGERFDVVLQRNAERLSDVAQAGEEVA